MNFRASFCDPFEPDIKELGPIMSSEIINKFEEIQWSTYLQKMSESNQDPYYSPSLEIENSDNKNGLNISALGDPKNIEWYVFYKRPKEVKLIFGLINFLKNNYMTEIQGQSMEDVLEYLNALINNNLDFLENKIK